MICSHFVTSKTNFENLFYRLKVLYTCGIYSATDISVDREDIFWTVLIYNVEFILTIFVPQKIH